MTIDDIRNKYTLKVANGSGVLVIAQNGEYAYIFTAYHVIKGIAKEELNFSFQDIEYGSSHPIELVEYRKYYDEDHDIAIIVIKNNFKDVDSLHLCAMKEYEGSFYHVGFPECRTESGQFKSIVHTIAHVDGGSDSLIECEYVKATKDTEVRGTSGGGIYIDGTHELVGIHTERANSTKKEFLGKSLFIPIACYIELMARHGLPIANIDKDTTTELLSKISNAKQICKYLREVANRHAEKLSVVRTFLYWNEDRSFDEVYYPLSLSEVQHSYNAEEKNIKINNDLRLFHKKGTCVAIIGLAGSGKTMLMKHIFLHAVRDSKIVPIMIVLRYMRERNLKEYIMDSFFQKENRLFDMSFKTGNLLIIFDGFDELSKDKRDQLIEEIQKLNTQYPDNRFIITSRPHTGIETVPGFKIYTVNPLLEEDIRDFISKQLNVLPEGEIYIEGLCGLLDNKSKYGHLADYLKSPLLLSMVILNYLVKRTLPEEKHLFYSEVFDTFAYLHDSRSKPGEFSRKNIMCSGLSREKIQNILEFFSYSSYCNGEYSFTRQDIIDYLLDSIDYYGYDVEVEDVLSDLQIAYSMIVEDSGEYTFTHRSLQEYFLVSCFKKSSKCKEQFFEELRELDNPDRSLWSLFVEMDNMDFNRYYTIPMLSKFVERMETDSELGNEIVVRYANYFDMKVDLSGSINMHCNFIRRFLEFEGLLDKLREPLHIANKAEEYYENIRFAAMILKSNKLKPISHSDFKIKYINSIATHPLSDLLSQKQSEKQLIKYCRVIIFNFSEILKYHREDFISFNYEKGILNLHQSIKKKIEELKQYCDSVDDKQSRKIKGVRKRNR